MPFTQDTWIEVIRERARQRNGLLASALVIARSDDKEGILAEMLFQGWLEESCRVCSHGTDKDPL